MGHLNESECVWALPFEHNKSLMCKHAPHPCFYEFLSVSLRPLQIRVSKSQMWRAHPLGKLALNPLGRLPLVLDVLVLAQAVAPASRCDSDTSFFEARFPVWSFSLAPLLPLPGRLLARSTDILALVQPVAPTLRCDSGVSFFGACSSVFWPFSLRCVPPTP